MRDMKRSSVRQLFSNVALLRLLFVLTLSTALLVLVGCTAHADPAAEAPPPANIVPGADPALFTVDHPEQFPLITAVERPTTSELVVTGTVTPDVARNVPVVSLASGRVVAIHARLGDTVKKGQLLLTIRSDDVAGGFDAYRKAVADELLARKQLNRAVDLYAHGAIAQHDLEVAQDAEDEAKVTLDTATEHLRLLGNDPDKPMGIVDIVAPTSGVITDQEVTNAATVQAYSSPSPFTISDLSTVWIVCDVYENDLATCPARRYRGDHPERLSRPRSKGRVSNIGAILDPSIRTAKVRHRSRESRNHAAGHVCESHLPRSNHRDAHHCPGVRRPAHARSRFCFCSRARQEVSPRGSRQRRPAAPRTRICRKSSQDSSRGNRWLRTRWSWTTCSLNNG